MYLLGHLFILSLRQFQSFIDKACLIIYVFIQWKTLYLNIIKIKKSSS